MELNPTVCFIGMNESACQRVEGQLKQFLGKHLQIKTCCLRHMAIAPDTLLSDIYVVSCHTVYDLIKDQIPPNKKVIIANRTLEIDRLDEVLALPQDTEALLVSTWEETAKEGIRLLRSFGINNIKLYPFWPGKRQYPKHLEVAITAGLPHLVPSHINRIVDVGIRTLDLSTFVELIVEMSLPKEVINEISSHYISAIISSDMKRQKALEQTKDFKRRLEVILNTVDQPIIAMDENMAIVVFNPAAESLLGINSTLAISCNINKLLPELNSEITFQTGISLVDSIQKIKDNYYVVNTSLITDNKKVSGVVTTLKPVNEVKELENKVRRELRNKGHLAKHTFSDIIGNSNELKQVIEMGKKFAGTDLTILIEGGSGTGKELFAQAIHNASPRRNSPFVAVNFAALPENLVESELFGYEDGAFTGAKKGGKKGLFEEAHTGTIFLDEIGDASLEVQKKLLRVLEEKEVRRVGGSVVTPIDVRVIAATNREMEQYVKDGKFRQDLYFRLCTLPLFLPSLQDRKDDILLLINFFARKLYSRELLLDLSVLDFFNNYPWPGNIRELENVVKYMCSVVECGEAANIKHLPTYMVRRKQHHDYNMSGVEPAGESRLETIAIELARLQVFEPVKVMLMELKKADIFKRGLGRQSIMKELTQKGFDFPEHKVRSLLKLLEQTGCVVSGTTRQGSKITSLGEKLVKKLDAITEEDLQRKIGVE